MDHAVFIVRSLAIMPSLHRLGSAPISFPFRNATPPKTLEACLYEQPAMLISYQLELVTARRGKLPQLPPLPQSCLTVPRLVTPPAMMTCFSTWVLLPIECAGHHQTSRYACDRPGHLTLVCRTRATANPQQCRPLDSRFSKFKGTHIHTRESSYSRSFASYDYQASRMRRQSPFPHAQAAECFCLCISRRLSG